MFTIFAYFVAMVQRTEVQFFDYRTRTTVIGKVSGVQIEDGSGKNFLVYVNNREYFVNDVDGKFWMTDAHVRTA